MGTPGRLMDLMERGSLVLSDLKIFVLDETDEMLSMGFQKDIERIFQFVKNDFAKVNRDSREIQHLLFSATVPEWVRQASQAFLSSDFVFVDMIKDQDVKTSTTVKHLSLAVDDHRQKMTLLPQLIQTHGGQTARTIVFTDTKQESRDVEPFLKDF